MIEDPILSNIRMCSAWYYSDLAQRNVASMKEAINKETKLKRGGILSREELDAVTPELNELYDIINDSAVIAIVFSGMAVEAYIYDYASRNLGKSYTDDHVESMNLESKWVVIPKLITGTPFPKDRHAFQLLKKLIKARNALVHSKSRNFRSSELTDESVANRDIELRQAAQDAVQTISLLATEIETIHTDEKAKFLLHVNAQ